MSVRLLFVCLRVCSCVLCCFVVGCCICVLFVLFVCFVFVFQGCVLIHCCGCFVLFVWALVADVCLAVVVDCFVWGWFHGLVCIDY